MIDITNNINIVAKKIIGMADKFQRFHNELGIEENLNHENETSFFNAISSSNITLKVMQQIMNEVEKTTLSVRDELSKWNIYSALWEMDKGSYFRRYEKAKHAVVKFETDITCCISERKALESRNAQKIIQFVELHFSALKSCLLEHSIEWQSNLTSLMNANASRKLLELHDFFDENIKRLSTVPDDVISLRAKITITNKLRGDLDRFMKTLPSIDVAYRALSKFDIKITDEESRMLNNLRPRFNVFHEQILHSERKIKEKKKEIRQQLEESISIHQNETILLKKKFISRAKLVTSNLPINEALKHMATLHNEIQFWIDQEKNLKPGLDLFHIDLPQDKALHDCERMLDFLDQVWNLAAEWDNSSRKWSSQLFVDTNVEYLETKCDSFSKNINKLRRETGAWDVWIQLREKVDRFKLTLPLLQDLRCKAFRFRHWELLKKKLEKNFDSNLQTFTFQSFYSLELHQYSDIIGNIAANANKELKIEDQLTDIKCRWEQISIKVISYKSIYYKVSFSEDLISVLDDDIVSIAAMKSSKCYEIFKDTIDLWENILSTISEVLDVTMAVQRKWLYLESIFLSGGDINKQLPEEYASFASVNESFTNWMKTVVENNRALDVCYNHRQALTNLIELDEKLEQIQKCLDQYLELKRTLFPRFYFVSDDDLLEILGKSKNLKEIQKFIKKCFEGAKKLKFDLHSRDFKSTIVSGVIGSDGEELEFVENILLEGPVEECFGEILKAIKAGTRKALCGCVQACKAKKKEMWVKQWQGQVSIRKLMLECLH